MDILSLQQRYERLMSGEVEAATLPQPFYELARQAGVRVLMDGRDLPPVPMTISFRAEALAERGDAVRGVLAAYERAVTAMNAIESDEAGLAWLNEEILPRLRERFAETGNDGLAGFQDLLLEVMIWPELASAYVLSEAEFSAGKPCCTGRDSARGSDLPGRRAAI